MGEVTQILTAIERGEGTAAEVLLPLKTGGNFGVPGSYEGVNFWIVKLEPYSLGLTALAFTNGHFLFQMTGEPGKTALIQASTDLRHWTTLGSCVLSNSPVPFTDPQSAQFPRRFYRLVLPEGPPWIEECRWSGGQMTFNPVGMPGLSVVIAASTNLAAWTPIATNLLGSTPSSLSDPQSSLHPKRFYRLLKQ